VYFVRVRHAKKKKLIVIINHPETGDDTEKINHSRCSVSSFYHQKLTREINSMFVSAVCNFRRNQSLAVEATLAVL
jgi:hypothetical protein